jgi:blue copper oxidase
MNLSQSLRHTTLTTLIMLTGCAPGPNAPGHASFASPLPIPPLAESSRDGEGRLEFELEAREGTREFRPGYRTATRGVNGEHLAPTLRMQRGDEVVVHLSNALSEATTMHWHGMELPAAMDGGPHQMVAPGATWSPTWTVRQPAATLWYHPHPHGATERHVYSGMVGMILVDDDTAFRDGALPDTYGVDDVPVLVQDVTLDGDGQLVRRKPWYNQVGPLGEMILVNGAVTPYHEVGDERIRLRLLNASLSRVYDFGFSDGRAFHVVASDGGLLTEPLTAERIQLSPGERADIVVRMEAGDTVRLLSHPPELGTDFINDRLAGGRDRFELLELRAAGTLRASPPLPTRLAELERPDPTTADTTRTFRVSSSTINGRSMDMGRIDAHIRPGATEIWEVEGIAVPHNFHVHGVRFRILAMDGSPPPPEFAGWKDTVYLDPDTVTRLLIEFPEHEDDVPFMFHCHFLRHEDDGAMGQFLVRSENR